jgi:DNA-binding NtrC family response regulator
VGLSLDGAGGRRATNGARHSDGGSLPPGLVGASDALARVWERARRLADLREPVLITGERGVGKLTLAEAMWCAGDRAGPLVTFDAALEPVQGLTSWMGRLLDALGPEGAAPATVVVRHIELLDPWANAALAALLDQGAVVVATATLRPEIAASGEVVERFSTVLEVPPLRQRPADIRPLAFDALHGLTHGRGRGITAEALAALEAADWPGNVRELRTTVRRAAAARLNGDLSVLDLPASYASPVADVVGLAERTERALIRSVLAAHAGRRADAAGALGISRSTLYRKLRAYGLDDRGG